MIAAAPARHIHAELIRRHREAPDRSISDLGDHRLPRKRNLVQAPRAVHHKRALDTQLRQRRSHRVNYVFRKNAQNLRLRPRRIRERSQQIEHGSHADLFSRGCRVPRGRVCGLREQKSDANLPNRPPILFERQIDPHAQRFQHVCRAASRAGRAIPMLCHARARRRRNDRRRR
jgi:hypothetical protein